MITYQKPTNAWPKYPTWGKLLKANENNYLQDQAVNFNRNFMELVEFEGYFTNEGRYEESVKYGIGEVWRFETAKPAPARAGAPLPPISLNPPRSAPCAPLPAQSAGA